MINVSLKGFLALEPCPGFSYSSDLDARVERVKHLFPLTTQAAVAACAVRWRPKRKNVCFFADYRWLACRIFDSKRAKIYFDLYGDYESCIVPMGEDLWTYTTIRGDGQRKHCKFITKLLKEQEKDTMREHKRPMFQQRHYEEIADTLFSVIKDGAPSEQQQDIISALVKTFARDNKKFSASKFRERILR